MDRSRTDRVDSVIAQLRREPWRFSLEQCIRILRASGEMPALRGDLGLAFAPAEVSLRDGTLQVHSLGPGGADGVLPYGWLEWLQQAAQDKNSASQDFIHLFQQRLIQHHCRSLSLYRLATPYARREDAPGFTLMRVLCGFDLDAVKKHQSGQLQRLLSQSSGLANRRRSTAGFVALVAATLGITVHIEEFIGRWQPLPLASQSRTGCWLGRNSVAGRRIWNQHAALRVHLHAKNVTQWREFLPGSQGFLQLSKLAEIWFGAGITLELMMRGTLTLEHRLTRAAPPRLGYTAQLAGRKPAMFHCQQHLEENSKWI